MLVVGGLADHAVAPDRHLDRVLRQLLAKLTYVGTSQFLVNKSVFSEKYVRLELS